MLKFYFNGSPNPSKVALFLEETALPYQPMPVDTRKGEQFKPEFLAINPNAKVPAIDDDGVVVFDSNAILLYLAEKTGKFLPANTPRARGEFLSWPIVDMEVWGWARMIPFILGEDAWAKYPNVKRLVDEVQARPAAARAVALKDKFAFKAEMDAEARRNMFKHIAA